MLTAKEL